jgi:hypothetical protein
MFKHLPGRDELAVFAVMAVVCVAVVQMIGETGAGLFFLTFPVFVFSAVLGLWKSGRLRASDDLE